VSSNDMDARMLGDAGTTAVPELAKGDEILFNTARGHVHAVRLSRDGVHLSVSERGNLYATVTGYRIHTAEPRSSFGNERYFTFRADTVRKF
jgi:hypothetical protein